MNIFIHELKQYFMPFVLWALSLFVLHLVASIEFGIFASSSEIIDAMAQFEIFFQALGSESADITTPIGFISLLSIYIILPLSIYSGVLGSIIINKEEKNKTAEFLFTLPVTRQKVLLSKVLVSIIYTFLLTTILIASILLIYLRYEPDSDFYQYLIYLGIGVFATQLMFLSIGAALSSILRYYKLSGSITVGIIITTFMINMAIGFIEDLDILRYISLYNYFDPVDMLNGTFEYIFILLASIVFIGSISSIFYFYPKRDLYI
jgi:ABC-2 type transport system permease protein